MSEPLKPKSFWSRPEGKTGAIFLIGILALAGFGFLALLPTLIILAQQTLTLAAMILVLVGLLYMVLDNRTRTLVWYMYKSLMRWITGVFVQIDPIAILKGYVDHLRKNLHEMERQINRLRGQMHKLREIIKNNQKEIKSNLQLASEAKNKKDDASMILKTRKAGRLQESNVRLEELDRKMEVMYRVLTKMRENSYVLAEDIQDQVMVKEQEQKAIHASNNAMKSAMSIISGDPDKRAMFDAAMDAITEDVANKVGEMENFMNMSSKFMESIDLQNGVFEEEGLKMLEKWEQEGVSLLLGEEKDTILNLAKDDTQVLDLNAPVKEPVREPGYKNQYDSFFDLE
jgi:TolA-binding protein